MKTSFSYDDSDTWISFSVGLQSLRNRRSIYMNYPLETAECMDWYNKWLSCHAKKDSKEIDAVQTFKMPLRKAIRASFPGPSTVRPSSSGPQLAEYTSMCWRLWPRDRDSIASVTSPSSIRTPPMRALKAMPSPQMLLFAAAATSPAQRVPWRLKTKISMLAVKTFPLLIESPNNPEGSYTLDALRAIKTRLNKGEKFDYL